MGELTNGVNWIAVGAGAIISFLVGWLWYSPKLFGTKWAQGVGVDLGGAHEMPKNALIMQAVGLFLMSWFVGVTAVSEALFTVILATIAFTVLAYSGGAFAQKSAYSRAVDAGYWIVALVIMIICQGVLRNM